MPRRLRPAVLILLLLAAPPGRADEAEPPAEEDLPTRVNAAIDAGVAWLQAAQHKDGSWGPCISGGRTYDGRAVDPECYHLGPTAFSIFTLARCGVSPKDKGIKKGLKWLEKRGNAAYPYTSYESAAIALALCALYGGAEPAETRGTFKSPPKGSAFKRSAWRLLHDRVRHLVGDGAGEPGTQKRSGGWGYVSRGPERSDVSATQFALLALREASRAGFPVEEASASAWSRAADYLQGMQLDGGGFPYERREEGWTLGMTAAGLASLLIVKEQMELAGQRRPDGLQQAIDRAFAELGSRYSPMANVSEDRSRPSHYHYCYLYAVERVGGLAGRQLLGGEPWYPPGAAYLLAQQKSDGSWIDPTGMGPHDVLGTCFALLFLKRTTMPSAVITPGD